MSLIRNTKKFMAKRQRLNKKFMANMKKLLGYAPEIIRWIEKELKKNGDLIFDILTQDQLKQWHRYEERKNSLRMNPGKKQETKKYKSTSKEETEPTHKSTSPQAGSRKEPSHKLRVQAYSLNQQAQGSGNPDKDERAQAPGYKQPE